VLTTDTDSPLPLRKLGGVKGDLANSPLPPTLDTLDAGFLMLPRPVGVDLDTAANLSSNAPLLGVELADKGLGGWFEIRPPYFGGCGKDPILTVFRRPLPGGRGPAGESVVLSVGILMAELEWPLGIGRADNAEDETARVVAGDGSNEEGVRDVGPMLETRDFLGTGSDGRGPVGGAIEGRAAGRGSVAMVRWFCCDRV
jgi:hypothetical protein